jgi:hypothetical protein
VPKASIWVLTAGQLRDLQALPETGMGFHIVEGNGRYAAVLADGQTLPLYQDPQLYDVDDLIAGEPIPTATTTQFLNIAKAGISRAATLSALVTLVPGYGGSTGALPLIGQVTLANNTRFYRYVGHPITGSPVPSSSDPRFVASSGGGALAPGTFLTTTLDRPLVSSGFGAVGRFSLPLPVPASQVFEYELPKGAQLKVGTVSPMFGQSGGGVEVQTDIKNKQAATQLIPPPIPDF